MGVRTWLDAENYQEIVTLGCRGGDPTQYETRDMAMNIEIADFTQHNSGTLRGFVGVRFPHYGLEVRDIALHEKNGKRWLRLRHVTSLDSTSEG